MAVEVMLCTVTQLPSSSLLQPALGEHFDVSTLKTWLLS